MAQSRAVQKNCPIALRMTPRNLLAKRPPPHRHRTRDTHNRRARRGQCDDFAALRELEQPGEVIAGQPKCGFSFDGSLQSPQPGGI
jgi:hypothetical protein